MKKGRVENNENPVLPDFSISCNRPRVKKLKSLRTSGDLEYNGWVSREASYFLLTVPAAGDEPEIKTDNTDLNSRNKLRDGL